MSKEDNLRDDLSAFSETAKGSRSVEILQILDLTHMSASGGKRPLAGVYYFFKQGGARHREVAPHLARAVISCRSGRTEVVLPGRFCRNW